MTVVETYTQEAKAEVLAFLRGRVRRIGECLISHDNLRRFIEQRFGLKSHYAARITFDIEDDLKERGILEIWQEGGTSGTIFSVHVD